MDDNISDLDEVVDPAYRQILIELGVDIKGIMNRSHQAQRLISDLDRYATSAPRDYGDALAGPDIERLADSCHKYLKK
ncbi:hypothetical protein [Xanthomonas albilineans]|uniref:hypothetical protein n=1 Tax=Xanthomonas albilineans TaxID=29447 RepID=UPI0012D3C1B3|nr:hypothetical protein [Xanthomonas albilineans]